MEPYTEDYMKPKVSANRWYTGGQAQPGAVATPAAQPTIAGPYVAPVPQGTATAGMAEADWRNMTNLARRSAQSSWGAGAESLKRDLGGSGFRAGESGIADSALGQYYGQQAESLGQTTSGMAVEEAKNKFMQNLNIDNMNFEKSKWGQEFGASREDQAMADMLRYMELMQGNQAAPYASYWNATGNAING